ncbi:hypothetical protein A2Z23_02095 [Candidatus Curtissbacteria bacterium RBG_16_39_7]|uniref:Uncharacterized protein n=1 Tax=Candidatus Curtissbacteria bacterium RBG_16_39_7 TaxID=1797707 RepID=A0A1F5G1T6_9BACT|nr:MAG: hypothetical protein A2Z23_02095 [Candidatus Curtissbacteria bacterium RBG_16_39_7]
MIESRRETKQEEMLGKQERWDADANFYLLAITELGHEYFGRVGQVMHAMPASFVGNIPLHELVHKLGSEEFSKDIRTEQALCLVVKIDLSLVMIRESGQQYRLINKHWLEGEEIEVEDENGSVGRLSGWYKANQPGSHFGIYTARFEEGDVETPDWLMMQEPTWEFRVAGTR